MFVYEVDLLKVADENQAGGKSDERHRHPGSLWRQSGVKPSW
jgi:hypothetical protein